MTQKTKRLNLFMCQSFMGHPIYAQLSKLI